MPFWRQPLSRLRFAVGASHATIETYRMRRTLPSRLSVTWIALLGTLLCALVALVTPIPSYSASAAPASNTGTATVRITGVDRPPGFVPDLLTIHTGDTVVFVNVATPASNYSIAASDQSFASPAIAAGQQWSHVFTHIGQVEYTAPAHASLMVGLITVVAASTPLLPTPQPAARATAIAQLTHPQGSHSTSGSLLTLPAGVSPSIVIVGVVVIVALVGIALFLLVRSRRRRATASSQST